MNVKEWSEFVLDHPYGNIFQTPEMYEVYKKYGKFEPIVVHITDENGNIIGLLLALIQKEINGFLGILTSRSIIWGGPIVLANNLNTLNLLLKEYNNKIEEKAIYSQFRNLRNWSKEERNVFLNNRFNYEEHLDILIDLKKPEDILFKEMHQGRRKNIRRAENIPLEFFEIEDSKDIDICINLIDRTYKRIKLPCPDKQFFHNADKILTGNCSVKKFVAKYNGEIISCRFVLCYKGLIYDWFAGTNENQLDKYPNDFLPWKIIQWAKKNGYLTFDFGGAGKPNIPYGVRDYKLKFGGELVNFGRFETIHKPLLMKLGKIGLKLYKKIK